MHYINLKNNQPKVVIFYHCIGVAIPKFFWKIAVAGMYPKTLRSSVDKFTFGKVAILNSVTV